MRRWRRRGTGLRFLVEPAADRLDLLIEKDGEVIGKAGAWQVPEIGFLLHPDHWGKGLALEAMTAVIAHLEAVFSALPQLTAEVDPRNAASLRLLAKLGFQETHREERTCSGRANGATVSGWRGHMGDDRPEQSRGLGRFSDGAACAASLLSRRLA